MYEDLLSERLSKLRTAKGVSAREMSLAIEQNESYINRIENGKSLPSMQAFFYIMLPLIKPMTITIIILNGMWIWNDYLLPFLVLETSDFKTITLEIYYVKMTAGQYVSPWETLFPSVLIAILPLIVIFLLFQKHFVKGVTAGAVKS